MSGRVAAAWLGRRLHRPTHRQVVGTVVTVLLIAGVAPFVVFAVPQVIGAQESFVVLSGSMEPTLSPGDVVIVGAPTAIAVGDVITFRAGSEVPTTHRVVGVDGTVYTTQGDANEDADERPVTRADVIGEVVLVIPVIGHLILWVNTPTGYVTLVVAPLVLFALNELYTWAWGRSDRYGDGADASKVEETGDGSTGAVAAPRDTGETVAVAVADLKLTVLATGLLLAYAAWNLRRELTVFGAPDPVSTGALTAGLLGLLFAAWLTASAFRARRATASDELDGLDGPEDPGLSPVADTDGGTDLEERR